MEAFIQNNFLCLKGKQLGCLNGVFEALHCPYIIDKTFEPKLYHHREGLYVREIPTDTCPAP